MSRMEMYRDPISKETLVEVEVENRNTKNLVLPSCNNSEGNLCQPGVSRYKIYSSQLPNVMALVEPEPETIDAAKKLFGNKLSKYLKDNGLDRPDADPKNIEKALGTVTFSVESCFTELTCGRDILPLVRCDVVKKDIMNTESDEHSMAGILARHLQAQQIPQGQLTISDVATAVAIALKQVGLVPTESKAAK